ncbi:hypothetical protein D3C86_1912210 [compost metagenome]
MFNMSQQIGQLNWPLCFHKVRKKGYSYSSPQTDDRLDLFIMQVPGIRTYAVSIGVRGYERLIYLLGLSGKLPEAFYR